MPGSELNAASFIGMSMTMLDIYKLLIATDILEDYCSLDNIFQLVLAVSLASYTLSSESRYSSK